MTEPLDLAEMRRVAESGSCIAFDSALVIALIDQLEARDRENEQLRLAICGGEDAPGYAASLPLETILNVAEENTRSWFAEADRAEASEARLAQVEEALHRIAEATPANTNSATADRMASWVHAVAYVALSPSNPETQDGTR